MFLYTKQVTVAGEVGLHARPATRFIQKAAEFKSAVVVEYGPNHTNAKSLLGVLALGVNQGATLTLTANGPDEKAAVETLAALLEDEQA